MNADEIILGLQKAYGVELPDSYKEFLRFRQYRNYPQIELDGLIRGVYDLTFDDPLLIDYVELGVNAGIYDIEDLPWTKRFKGYVPLCRLEHSKVNEPKIFLMLDAAQPPHRVFLFDGNGWSVLPVANSFTEFLAYLPKANVG